MWRLAFCCFVGVCNLRGSETFAVFAKDPAQPLERTCFQTGQGWSTAADLRSDVAIVYGIDAGLPKRIESWRDHGYRIHVMSGVSWGHYQDYLYGRFDGINHEDEAQTDREGHKVSHGGDVYYMCPGTNYGKFLCPGVQRALDAGAEAIHLEEPEFWVRSGYSDGFKREWRNFYGEDWQPPHASVDAQWKASKLKYFLYRRALQQVFDYVQKYNQQSGRHVRCYVPTHSLLNYAHWRIVSPESSLALLNGCDGYIAQVWTGTSRTPNVYQGKLRERTFETAFLEYGAMQNLVHATGRRVWYLNDPIEDNPNHDWKDYQANWESTLVASLFQPEVSHFEVAPWPERIFKGRYPRSAPAEERLTIPPPYATELQVVMNASNNLDQPRVGWECGTPGLGVVIGDSLMFQRGDPAPSDPHLGNVYGLALPFLKRGMPITPVQLENVALPVYLKGFHTLILSYQGMKPLTAAVDDALAAWVKTGGSLVVVDDDSDPFNAVSEWWNTHGLKFATPRQHLFQSLGLPSSEESRPEPIKVGKGRVVWIRQNPVALTQSQAAADRLIEAVKGVAHQRGVKWSEANHLLLRRGPYVIAAGLDESIGGDPLLVKGKLVNLFDPELKLQTQIAVTPGSRYFLLDLARVRDNKLQVLASACKALPEENGSSQISWTVEGVEDTPAVVLFWSPKGSPRSVSLDGVTLDASAVASSDHLVWVRFNNRSTPRRLSLSY